AHEQSGAEQERAGDGGAERDEGGPGTIADEPPAGAEERRADDEVAIDPAAAQRRIAGRFAERTGGREAAQERDHGDAADHDEGERRIPRAAGDVEKAEHLRRLRHAGDAEPDGEEEAADEADRGPHGVPPTWRTMKTVSMPAPMKMQVAASERGDRRLTPHRPCPLVQPLARRVP